MWSYIGDSFNGRDSYWYHLTVQAFLLFPLSSNLPSFLSPSFANFRVCSSFLLLLFRCTTISSQSDSKNVSRDFVVENFKLKDTSSSVTSSSEEVQHARALPYAKIIPSSSRVILELLKPGDSSQLRARACDEVYEPSSKLSGEW